MPRAVTSARAPPGRHDAGGRSGGIPPARGLDLTVGLLELVLRVPEHVAAEVRKTRDLARPALQEALRSECRLALRTAADRTLRRTGASVPVDVTPALPDVLMQLEFPEGIEVVLLLSRYRAALERQRAGAAKLLELRAELDRLRDRPPGLPVIGTELEAVRDWSQALLDAIGRQDPLATLLAVDEDVLGAYRMPRVGEWRADAGEPDDRVVNPANIQLYWAVIGLASRWLGCSVADLTVVVLAHELAHAYTQLGADIEGRRWLAADYAQAERDVTEGLAQYYTDRVLRRLSHRYPGAHAVFEQMVPNQPPAYQVHQEWRERSTPEAVRLAMLEMRRHREGTRADFERRLAAAREQMEPGSCGPAPGQQLSFGHPDAAG